MGPDFGTSTVSRRLSIKYHRISVKSFIIQVIMYGTIPYIDLRDEKLESLNLDGGGLSSMDRMCVKTD